MVKDDERKHKLCMLSALSCLVDVFKLDLDEDAGHVLQATLNLIEFESKRFLIQEVSYDIELELPRVKKKKANFGGVQTHDGEKDDTDFQQKRVEEALAYNQKLKGHLSGIVKSYFNSAIYLFQDDARFAEELHSHFFNRLPMSMQQSLQDYLVTTLLEQKSGEQVTSKQLQFQCKLVYTLALTINPPSIQTDQNMLSWNQSVERIVALSLDMLAHLDF